MVAHQKSLIKGSLFMIVAFFCVSLFGLFLKLSSEDSSSLWSLFLGYVFALLIQSVLTLRNGISFIRTKRPMGHFFRGFIGVLATLFYLLALKLIPLMNATLLFNTTPLFIPLIAWIFLGTKIPGKIWVAIGIGFLGAICILRPTSGFFEVGALFGLLSGICLAIAFITVQILATTEPRDRINFYFFLIGTICSLLLFPYFGPMHSYWAIFYSFLVGITFVLVQQFLVLAYSYASAHEVGVFQYVSVVFAGIWGWLIWNERPDLIEYLGIVLVMIGGSLVILLRKKNQIP